MYEGDIAANLDHTFGYGGGHVASPARGRVLYEAGAVLVDAPMSGVGRQRTFSHSPYASASCFEVHPKTDRFAVSERSNRPHIALRSYPDGDVLARLGEGATSDFTALGFSRDGNKLVAVGGDEEPRLRIWDLKTGGLLPGAEAVVPSECDVVSFNPRSDNELVACGPSGIFFFRMSKSLDEYTVTRKIGRMSEDEVKVGSGGDTAEQLQAIVEDAGRAQQQDTDSPENQWLSCCWTRESLVVASNAAQQIVVFDPETGVARQIASINGGVVAMSLIYAREFIVAGCEDGVVRWLDQKELSVVREVKAAESGVTDDVALSSIVSIAPQPDFHDMVVGCASGALFVTQLDKDEDEEEESKKAPMGMPSLSEAGRLPTGLATASDGPRQIGDFHTGAVLGLAVLPRMTESDKLLASGGQDGTIRIWDYSKHKLAAKVAFSLESDLEADGGFGGPAAVTALASHAQCPLLAAGFVDGSVRLLVVVRTGGAEAAASVVCTHNLHSSTVVDVAFHPTQNVLATVGADGMLFLLDVRPSLAQNGGDVCVFAFANLGTSEEMKPQSIMWRGTRELVVNVQSGETFTVVPPRPTASVAPGTVDASGTPVDAAVDITSSVRLRANFGRAVVMKVDVPSDRVADIDGTPASAFLACPRDKQLRRFTPTWLAGDDSGGSSLEDAGSAAQVAPATALAGHEKGVLCVDVSSAGGAVADGAVAVVSGSADGVVGVWGVSRGQSFCKATAKVHAGAVARVAMSRDGLFAFSAGADGCVQSLMLGGTSVGEGAGSDRDVVGADGKVLHSKYLDAAQLASQHNALLDEAAAATEEGRELSDAAQAAVEVEEANEKYVSQGAFLARLEARNGERASSEHESARAVYLKEVAILGYRLKDLLQRNDKVPELEKLDREEFVVDTTGHEKATAANQAKADEVRARLERSNLERDVIARRIREQCWDSMEVALKALKSLQADETVYNMTLVKRTPKELRQLERIVTLRRIELREIEEDGRGKLQTWDGLLDEIPDDTDWILNCGLLPPTADPVEAAKSLKARREASAKGAATDEKGGEDDDEDEEGQDEEAARAATEELTEAQKIIQLIYHPMAARSPNQKRTQIILLKELIRHVMIRYNERFDELFHHKEAEVDKIEAKNSRIEEILTEIAEEQDYYKPAWAEDERPANFLDVTQEEIGFERYITEAERKRAEEEERKRKEAAAQNTDDGPERALAEMMDGTLETQDELSKLEQDLVREPWMDELSEAEMSEEQKKTLAEFEARQKVIMEEKAKHRKALEGELKKLKSEIKDIVFAFDNRVHQLAQDYLVVRSYIHSQEMHMTRLGMAVQEREDGALREERLLVKLDKLCDVRDEVGERHDEYQARYEAFRERVEGLEAADARLDKSFKQSLTAFAGPIDADMMKILQSLFKQRAHGQGGSSYDRESQRGMSTMQMRRSSYSRRRSHQGSTTMMANKTAAGSEAGMDSMKSAMKSAMEDVDAGAGSLDPFKDQDVSAPSLEEKEEQERKEALVPLSQDVDAPEGFEMDDETWNKVQELRHEKIESELDLRKARRQLSDMEAVFTKLGDELDAAEDKIGEVQNQREILLEQRAVAGSNLELLIRLQQGQDEMESGAVVTDYSDALVLHRSVVESTNKDIRSLGGDVVQVLTKIKDFRKDINFMLWESDYLEASLHDKEEHYTDLHMLRVTKTLQEFLKGGDLTERRRKEVDKADAKLTHVKAASERSQAKLRKTLAKGRKALKQREAENDRLASQKAELEASVAVRQSIQESRAAGRGGAADPGAQAQQRMKAVTTRRKLIDLARAQTDEIEFLRQELDRLRQRTFPSFAHSRMPAGNVDEF